jgi:hypothetical protein
MAINSSTDSTLMPAATFQRLLTPHLSRPVDFVNCERLVGLTQEILRGWDAKVIVGRGRGHKPPHAIITKKRTCYHWESKWPQMARSWDAKPPHSAFSALLDIHYEWSDWFVRDWPDHFCLHAAAVEINGAAVIFPSDQKAGKSVLAAQFAEANHRVFGDDVIALTPHAAQVMSLGIVPRLRLPLPENLGPRFYEFINRRRGPGSDHYQYLNPPKEEFADFGVKIPVSAIVLLDRSPDGAASLQPVSQGIALKQLIRKNFAETMPVVKIFETLRRLTSSVPCHRLTFSKGPQAITLLQQVFGAKP